ncbi:MAG: 6-phosphogluconolactonase [Acidobacteriota bacterium]|nr:6-phosphogluconolactonase [Acidobacteriota bacterium]
MFIEIGNKAIARNNRFTIALSGGSTPKLLFQTLASEEFRSQIDWAKTSFFFGDERHAPPDSAESNYRMARENLFDPLEIPEGNAYRWSTEWQNAEEIAFDYEKTLIEFFKTKNPRFDLILLGMGADAHTASLFPETTALTETEKLAVSNWVPKLDTSRLTFTFPLINNAANIVFLVAGAEKAETLKTILKGEFQPLKFPAQAVKPQDGELLWFVDKTAAKLIESD